MSDATQPPIAGNTSDPTVERYILRVATVAFVREQNEIPQPLRRGEISTRDFSEEASVMERLLKSTPFVDSLHIPVNTFGFQLAVKTDAMQGLAPIFARDVFALYFNYPRSAQALPDGYSGVVIENFTVLYDGLSFCLFARVDDEFHGAEDFIGMHRYDWLFVDRVREILVAALTGEPGYQPIVIDPDDISADFTVTISRDASVTAPQMRMSGERPSAEIVVTLPMNSQSELEIGNIGYRILRGCSIFYRVMHLKGRRDATLAQMRGVVRSIGEWYAKLLAIPWWNIFRWSRFSLLRKMRPAIGQAAELYVDFNDIDLALSEEVYFCQSLIASEELLARQIPYFVEHMTGRSPDMAPTLRVLQFYEDETRSTLTSGSAALITLLSALIGAVVALVVAA